MAEVAFPEEAMFTLMVEVRGCLPGEEGCVPGRMAVCKFAHEFHAPTYLVKHQGRRCWESVLWTQLTMTLKKSLALRISAMSLGAKQFSSKKE